MINPSKFNCNMGEIIMDNSRPILNKSSRKPFSKAEYDRFNTMAFEKLKEDMPGFYIFQPEEDYGIDTFAYASKEAFDMGEDPLFAIELEAKKSGGWTGEYPYPTVHFLARKAHLVNQSCVPFWVQYNEHGTNALILPLPFVFNYPIKQIFGAKSSDAAGHELTSNDYYYDVAIDACTFGRDKLQDAVIDYFASILSVAPQAIKAMPSTLMGKGNKAYRALIQPMAKIA